MYEYRKDLCESNYDYPFQDPTLPTDVRLDNLMSLLTPEEKVIKLMIFFFICCFFKDRYVMDRWINTRYYLTD
jgi:hypothetical protein